MSSVTDTTRQHREEEDRVNQASYYLKYDQTAGGRRAWRDITIADRRRCNQTEIYSLEQRQLTYVERSWVQTGDKEVCDREPVDCE